MGLQTYEDLDVYRCAFDVALRVHRLADTFPKTEWYGGMADQIKRSSKSICANVAEGLSRQTSLPDKRRYIYMALGSCEETRVWLAFAIGLAYLPPHTGEGLRSEYADISRMLFTLQKNLKF